MATLPEKRFWHVLVVWFGFFFFFFSVLSKSPTSLTAGILMSVSVGPTHFLVPQSSPAAAYGQDSPDRVLHEGVKHLV